MSDPTPLGRPGPPQPELTDGIVVLRRLAEADIGPVYAACQDPEVQRWTTVPSPYRREHAEYFVRQYAPSRWRNRGGAVWAFCGEDRVYAGSMEIRIGAEDKAVGNAGFLCAPEARGRGWTTAALRLACEWSFGNLGLARIEWRAFVGNHASRRVAEKAGLVVEGTGRLALRHRDQRRDAWMGSLIASDLRKRP
ncbi:MAG: family N-acetyltransferase [Actinomycetia bacterium]|nr:family N-acetyltransferase [Actinomycetes bacterium]